MDVDVTVTSRVPSSMEGAGVVFIVDNGARDPGVERMRQISPHVSALTLTEVLLAAGCRYSPETRLLYPPAADGGMCKLDECIVFDRVIEVSDETVMLLTNGTGGLSRGQVSFCYEKLLRSRKILTTNDVAYSTVGKLVSLVTQWHWVQAALPHLQTPDYVYGYGPEVVDASNFENAIYSSPLNLYQWRPNERPEGEVWDTFVINRPKGQPLLTTFLDKETSHEFLGADADTVAPALAAQLTAYAGVIKSLFAARVGELLWFIHGEQITFASFSHALYTSAGSVSFDKLALRFLAALKDCQVISAVG